MALRVRKRDVTRGPKPKPPELLKKLTLHVRVTAEQRDLLAAAAAVEGMELSTWIRWVALRTARKSSGSDGSANP